MSSGPSARKSPRPNPAVQTATEERLALDARGEDPIRVPTKSGPVGVGRNVPHTDCLVTTATEERLALDAKGEDHIRVATKSRNVCHLGLSCSVY